MASDRNRKAWNTLCRRWRLANSTGCYEVWYLLAVGTKEWITRVQVSTFDFRILAFEPGLRNWEVFSI